MKINYTKTYKNLENDNHVNAPEYLIVHHSGGTDANPLADSSNQTANDIEAYHISKGWRGLGYNYVIQKDGSIWAGRPEYAEGAHTVGYNIKSLGICLTGNFDATMPTEAQIASLKELLKTKAEQYNINLKNIVPHRKFAVKTCYGNKLSDDWARNLITTPTPVVPVGKTREEKEAEIIRLIHEL
ncbi:MAG: peptidoglycan recognition protein family protein [Candidatus Doudnabacteria bacterium]|nr:peptidoglycan recognition protein family protein [Candidatus Doudnabacteria bacterium]